MYWMRVNEQFKSQNRKILLFLDNVSSHTEIELSDVKLAFLPANTTTHTQPLDQGIVQNFKIFYRKHLVEHLVVSVQQRVQKGNQNLNSNTKSNPNLKKNKK